MPQKEFVVGIDGGGTKTVGALASEREGIVKKASAGPSAPRNTGIGSSVRALEKIIDSLRREAEPSFVFVGLADVAEQPRYGERIREALIGRNESLEGRVAVGSDQEAAFRSGTDQKEGVVLISGTGCVARGWSEGREARASGWGYLEDRGSAFWAGRRAFQALLFSFDGRGEETGIKERVWEGLDIESSAQFLDFVYEKPLRRVPRLSVFADRAAREGDPVARRIMRRAGEELAESALAVIAELRLGKEEFPFVLVGSMFKSPLLSETVKEEVEVEAPGAAFVRPEKEPVFGAVKIALERK